MLLGAPKPGSTLPPQGGKGGVQQPVQPQVPAQGGKGGAQQPVQPQVPARREGLGQMFPNYNFPKVQPPPPPRSPSIPTPRPQVQPPMPPQGGKGGVYQPMPGQVPPQGGKTAAPGTIFNPNNPNNVPMPGGKGAVQPGQPQVPAQGGKAPLTPEQQATLGNAINTRPMPQVSPPQGGFPQQPGQVPAQGGKAQTGQVPDDMRPFISNLPQVQQPQRIDPYAGTRYAGTGGPGLLMRPQVLPQKPMPANQALGGGPGAEGMPIQGQLPPQLGLAGLQNMLYGGKR